MSILVLLSLKAKESLKRGWLALFPDFSPEKWGESLEDLIMYAMYGFVCGFKLLPMQFVLSILSATQLMLILQISLRPGQSPNPNFATVVP